MVVVQMSPQNGGVHNTFTHTIVAAMDNRTFLLLATLWHSGTYGGVCMSLYTSVIGTIWCNCRCDYFE